MTNSLVGSVERPLASQLPATYTLSASREACDKNLKNQTRTRFIQLKLTTAVKSKVMESFQGGRERQTASPWGPCCRNRVFRRPLSGCQESGWTPYPPPSTPRPCTMNSSQAWEVGWRGLWHGETERVLTTDCCIVSIRCLSTQWRFNLQPVCERHRSFFGFFFLPYSLLLTFIVFLMPTIINLPFSKTLLC